MRLPDLETGSVRRTSLETGSMRLPDPEAGSMRSRNWFCAFVLISGSRFSKLCCSFLLTLFSVRFHLFRLKEESKTRGDFQKVERIFPARLIIFVFPSFPVLSLFSGFKPIFVLLS